MNPLRYIAITWWLTFASILAHAHPAVEGAAIQVTHAISICGRVKACLTLSPEALAAYPIQAPSEINIKSRKGETLRVLKGYTGVRLIDLLDKSDLVAGEPNDLKKTVIVATASDDYKAVFSWNELYNTSIGAGVLVLYANDGKPLADDEGRLALISIHDLHTGPRHVRWLKDVQVRKID